MGLAGKEEGRCLHYSEKFHLESNYLTQQTDTCRSQNRFQEGVGYGRGRGTKETSGVLCLDLHGGYVAVCICKFIMEPHTEGQCTVCSYCTHAVPQ